MDNTLSDWLKLEFLGHEVWRFVAMLICIFAGYLMGKIIAFFLSQSAKRVNNDRRPIFRSLLESLSASLAPFGLTLGVRFSLLFTDMSAQVEEVMVTIASVLVVLTIGWIVFNLVDVPTAVYKRWADSKESKLTDMLVPILRSSMRVTVVALTLVQVAQVVSDKPVSSILAGLGIGGLAFALAAQDSLKHLFGSVVIFTDRPFEVGDRLVVDGHDGPVEEVGFRSTRIRTLDGHLVTIPNGALVNKSILNISKRPHIRRICNITITYDTPPAKVKEAVQIVKDILKDHEGMHEDFPPQVYFKDFNADSLGIFVIYWYHPPAYWDYLAFCEQFNLEVLERFNTAGIDFAFPTQTLYLAGDKKRPLMGIQDLDKLPES